VGWVGQSNFAS